MSEKVAFRLNGVVGDESDLQSKTLLWSIDRKYKLVLKKMNGYRLFNAFRNYLAGAWYIRQMRPRSSFPYLSNYFSIFSDALRLCQKKFSNSGNKCPKKFSPLFYGFLFLKFLVLVVCHPNCKCIIFCVINHENLDL